MPHPYKHSNGHLVQRTSGGQFRRTTAEEIGIGGVCQVCGHFLLRHYDGDINAQFHDPAKWRYRCFTCEPAEPAAPEARDNEGPNG